MRTKDSDASAVCDKLTQRGPSDDECGTAKVTDRAVIPSRKPHSGQIEVVRDVVLTLMIRGGQGKDGETTHSVSPPVQVTRAAIARVRELDRQANTISVIPERSGRCCSAQPIAAA